MCTPFVVDEIDLQNPEWKYDPIPEIMDGKNIADFIDADILEVSVCFHLSRLWRAHVAETEPATPVFISSFRVLVLHVFMHGSVLL